MTAWKDRHTSLARESYDEIDNLKNFRVKNWETEWISYNDSLEGQALVTQDGYYPVSKEIAEEELTRLQLQ